MPTKCLATEKDEARKVKKREREKAKRISQSYLRMPKLRKLTDFASGSECCKVYDI